LKSLAASTEFTEYILELLEPIGLVRRGRYFGGIGFSCNSVQFAMMMGSTLYFVVDEVSREKYQQAGMQPFSYLTKKGRIQVRRYFELPEDVLADPAQLLLWAEEAVSVAGKTKRPSKVKTVLN
jgi:DNA transformation protein